MKKITLKKLVSNLVSTLLVLIILLMVFFVVSSKLSGGTPKIFGKELLTVLSGSMEPSILTGSIIAITPSTNPTSLKNGDVVTYKSLDNPNVLITHRIKEVQRKESTVQYITKGDNNDANDPNPIPSENIVGKYTGFTLPWVGYILNFVKSKVGTILLIITPGVLLIGWSIMSVWRVIARMDESDVKTENQ